MKLRKLTIQNIASIKQAEIEFDKGALAEDPLFLITGRTGAGKTTILNSICLALYDAVPCLSGVKDDRNRDDDLKISSPGQLMRKGSKKAEVTLTFLCGEVGYTAVWEAHYSNRKTRGEHRKLILSRSLTNNATGETLFKKSEINAEIRAAVGLTFEQFTRTTMLAQGQFAAFMRADEKDKADILEKLTGTEIYTRIGQKIFELMKKAELRHSSLSADISEIKLLNDEEISDIGERIRTLTLETTAATLKMAAIDKQSEWLRGQGRLQKSLEQTQSEYDRLTEITCSDTYKDKISGIKRYDSTEEIRAQMKRRAEMRKHIAELSADLDSFREDKATGIADGLCHIEKTIAKAQDRCRNLRIKIEEMRPMERVYADIQRIEEKASQLATLIRKRTSAEAYVKTTEKELTKSHKGELPLQENIEAIEKKSAELDSILKAIDSTLSEYDRSALTSAKSVVDNEILRVTHIMQLLETLGSRRGDLDETRKRMGQNAENLKSARNGINDLEARMPQLEADYERCRAFFDGQKTLADHIGQLRALYAESHTCPLCGNTSAEMLTDDTVNDMLEEARKRAEEANHILVDAKARHRSLKKEIKTLESRKEALSEEENRKGKLVDTTLSELKEVGCVNPDEVALTDLRNDEADFRQKSKDLEEKIRTVDDLLTQREEVNKKKEQNCVEKDKAVKKLQRQQQETIKLSEKLIQQHNSLKDSVRDIEVNIEQLTELTGKQVTVGCYESVIEALKEESVRYSQFKESLTEGEKEIADSTKIYTNCNNLIPRDFKVFIERYSPKPKELVDPEIRISEYSNTSSRMSGEIMTCESQLADLSRQIDSFFTESSFSREEVDEITRIPESTVTKWRADVQKVADELKGAEGALTGINRQIEQHNETKPEIAEGTSIESLVAEKEQTENIRDTAKEEITKLANRLKENEELQKTYLERIRQRDEACIQLNEWKLLNSVFGSADGARFRAIAQSYVLRALLVRANEYLKWLSSRYTLDCKDGSLAIDVVDLIHGNTVRNVSSLSGGESFVVSLALALGLSAISKDKIDVDILFIDEGFGSLDHDTLETVIETLDTLHRRGGRRVGIISHMVQLAERIPTQISLVPDGPGLSRVVIS